MRLISRIKKLRSSIDKRGKLFFSRQKAHRLRKNLIRYRGYRKVNRYEKSKIKKYAKKTFGSKKYWPWLAYYTEVREEFKEGWLPDDFYTVHILQNSGNRNVQYISDLKTLDYKLFPDIAIKPLFIYVYGNFYDPDGMRRNASEVISFLNSYDNEIVIKKDSGLGGNHVRFIDPVDFNLDELSTGSGYVIQPVIKQHEILKKIHPASINTIRVVTSFDKTGDIDVKFAKLRFGIGNSRVDNGSSGGAYCIIKNDGSLSEYAYNMHGQEIGNRHPTTDFIFSRAVIPNYEKILDWCVKSHHKYPFGKIVGWDIAVNTNSELVLLEWNLDPLIWSTEAKFGPFWSEYVPSGRANII